MLRLYILFALHAFISPSFASVEILSTLEKKFSVNPTSCREQESCALKRFDLRVQRIRFRFKNEPETLATYMTDVRMIYETKSIADLKAFAIVQQIRGCVFDSYWNGREVEKTLTVSRNHMGQDATFQHRHWQIDNDLPVPIYTSVELANGTISTHGLLRWNDNPKSLEANNAHFLNSKITHPVVFATDLPAGVQLYAEKSQGRLHAQNSSLEFRSCLFKTTDLPAQTDTDGKNVPWPRAIKCWDWESKNIYDFTLGRFTSPKAIDPVCNLE
jgi:hypothetical protein